MRIFVYEINDYLDLGVVGEYGIFHNPIVMYKGKEVIAELYDLETDTIVCQSVGCDHCISKGNSDCRLYTSNNISYAI